MTAKEKLRVRVEDLTEQEAEATLDFIASRGRDDFASWLDSRPEDDWTSPVFVDGRGLACQISSGLLLEKVSVSNWVGGSIPRVECRRRRVVERFDVVEGCAGEFAAGRPGVAVDEFLLQGGEEALGDGVVVAVAA
jgi:hypothetical protein